jgi:hypothetical protein
MQLEPRGSFGEVKEMVPVLDTIIKYEFERVEEQEKIFREFFHLNDGTEISSQERSDFIILYRHLLKRVILSLKSNNPSLYTELQEYAGQLQDEEILKDHNQFNLKKLNTLKLVSHDIAHSVGNIINGRFEQERKLYPVFTEKEKNERLPNKIMMEDELYSSLFSFGTSYATHIALAIDSQKYSFTFEEYIESYIARVMGLTIGSIEADLKSQNSRAPHLTQTIILQAEEIAEEIRKNPPAKVVECLRYIWDNRDNHRVLVDLFFKKVGPYIESLKKRKVYDVVEK